MTGWCGGMSVEAALNVLSDRTAGMAGIGDAEYDARLARLQEGMAGARLDGVFLEAGTNLSYFTGVRWNPSERLAGALVLRTGPALFVAPGFERGTFSALMRGDGPLHTWEEDEDPAGLVAALLPAASGPPRLGLTPDTPFGRAERLRRALPPGATLVSAEAFVEACRVRKSAAEIALMQRAFDITLTVQAVAARILRPGITTAEVVDVVDRAHRACGASGSSFCIVLFGSDTAFPPGVDQPKPLETGDTVLVDTGCTLRGYHSDLTRTYVFGDPSDEQRRVWAHEREAQAVAFAAAQPGAPCGGVDAAARAYFENQGYGPGYALPGLSHRTGHGVGLDIHEQPYIVRGNATPLAAGMCFSIEPMLCLPGRFGIRLEDHVVMTEAGPRWFTPPARSIDDPFGPGT